MSIEHGCSGDESLDLDLGFYDKLVWYGNKISDVNKDRALVLVGLGIAFNDEPDIFKDASDQYLKELGYISLSSLLGKPLAKIQESDLPSWRMRTNYSGFVFGTRPWVKEIDLRVMRAMRVSILNSLGSENGKVLDDLRRYFYDYFGDNESVLERAMELRRRLSE